MKGKGMIVTFFRQNHVRPDWMIDHSSEGFELFFSGLVRELAKFDIRLEKRNDDEIVITINSYADLLNSVRISSPSDGFSSLCVGHIIGKSANLDFMEDIKKAVNRIAFAPETIPPEDQNRKVCHNCGCGC